ncbi:MAG: dephospho-CoA kinase [Pseudomonadota bacterium]|nr:dephospho-CoA kinase [Pseudomonadota bacterium]
MKKIGITGSLSSGKTTASKFLSNRRGPLFSADNEVKKLYKKKSFINLIRKKFNIKNKSNIKSILKKEILNNKSNIKKLEKIIHPLVRKEMKKFIKKNKLKKFIFFEIPLLIESNLIKNFDVIFFIKAKKNIRLKRFKQKGGNQKLFHVLNNKQLKDKIKMKYSDHTVVNEKNLNILKKKLSDIFTAYE